jgi:hypothetical protein
MLHSYLGGGGGLIAAAAEVDQPRDIDMGRHRTGAGCIVAEGVGPTGRVGRSKTLCVCRCNARLDELVVATFNAKDDANAVRVDALDRRSIPRRVSFHSLPQRKTSIFRKRECPRNGGVDISPNGIVASIEEKNPSSAAAIS